MIVVMAPKKKIVPNAECCNPFKKHGWRVKGVRPISRQLSERDPSLGFRIRNKLCVLCRTRVMAGPTTSSSSETREVASPSTVSVVEELEDNISILNT